MDKRPGDKEMVTDELSKFFEAFGDLLLECSGDGTLGHNRDLCEAVLLAMMNLRDHENKHILIPPLGSDLLNRFKFHQRTNTSSKLH